VLLGDVGDLVREHGGDFVFTVGGKHETGIHADIAAERRERVDLALAEHEKGEGLLRFVAVGGQPRAQRVEPAGDQRIVERVVVVAQLRQHHAAVLLLLARRQQFPRRGTDIGQARLLRGSAHAGQGKDDGGREQGDATQAGILELPAGRMRAG
jgi:hypothetical protein